MPDAVPCVSSTRAAVPRLPARSNGSRGMASPRFPVGAFFPPRSPRPARWTAGVRRTRRSAASLSRVTWWLLLNARDGFAVTERLARWTAAAVEVLAEHPHAAAIFLPDGRAAQLGQRLRNPDLALTLERIGALGRVGFYEGETAQEM